MRRSRSRSGRLEIMQETYSDSPASSWLQLETSAGNCIIIAGTALLTILGPFSSPFLSLSLSLSLSAASRKSASSKKAHRRSCSLRILLGIFAYDIRNTSSEISILLLNYRGLSKTLCNVTPDTRASGSGKLFETKGFPR